MNNATKTIATLDTSLADSAAGATRRPPPESGGFDSQQRSCILVVGRNSSPSGPCVHGELLNSWAFPGVAILVGWCGARSGGLVDASVIALAEGLGIRRLATRDVRHFAAVRLRDGSAFELVVNPTDPDRA